MIPLFTDMGDDLISNLVLFPLAFVLSVVCYRVGFWFSNRNFPSKRKYAFELYGRKLWSVLPLLVLPWVAYVWMIADLPMTRVSYFLIGYMLLPIWITCLIQLIKIPDQRFYFFKVPMWVIFVSYLVLSGVLSVIIFFWQEHQIGAYDWEQSVHAIISFIYLLLGGISLFTEKPAKANTLS